MFVAGVERVQTVLGESWCALDVRLVFKKMNGVDVEREVIRRCCFCVVFGLDVRQA